MPYQVCLLPVEGVTIQADMRKKHNSSVDSNLAAV